MTTLTISRAHYARLCQRILDITAAYAALLEGSEGEVYTNDHGIRVREVCECDVERLGKVVGE